MFADTKKQDYRLSETLVCVSLLELRNDCGQVVDIHVRASVAKLRANQGYQVKQKFLLQLLECCGISQLRDLIRLA